MNLRHVLLKNDGQHPNKWVGGIETLLEETVPNYLFSIQILRTSPVSTATPQRTFFYIKRLKTYLREVATMAEVII